MKPDISEAAVGLRLQFSTSGLIKPIFLFCRHFLRQDGGSGTIYRQSGSHFLNLKRIRIKKFTLLIFFVKQCLNFTGKFFLPLILVGKLFQF